MSEKIVLVTGATRGLGRGMARGLASRGHVVAITGRDEAQLDAVVGEIEQSGGKGIPLLCEHRDDDAVERAFAQLAERTDGRLDLLVNNAAAVYGLDLVAPLTDDIDALILWENGNGVADVSPGPYGWQNGMDMILFSV